MTSAARNGNSRAGGGDVEGGSKTKVPCVGGGGGEWIFFGTTH